MHEFNLTAGGGFGGLRSLEAIMEVGLAVAALAFTAAIWLADDAGSVPLQSSLSQSASGQSGATHVTFPTVIVKGDGR